MSHTCEVLQKEHEKKYQERQEHYRNMNKGKSPTHKWYMETDEDKFGAAWKRLLSEVYTRQFQPENEPHEVVEKRLYELRKQFKEE